MLTHSPEIFRFVEPKVFQQAARAFGKDGTPLKILVVPALPHDAAGPRRKHRPAPLQGH